MKNDRRNVQSEWPTAIRCPYCYGSRTAVHRDTTKGKISVQCSHCGKFYIINFETMKAEKSQAIKNEELISSKK